jgi:hypothetical protein
MTTAVVRKLLDDANAYARAHEADVVAFHRRERLGRMQVLVRDVVEWIEERGSLEKLTALGVAMSVDVGSIVFEQGARRFEITARADMSVMVNGQIVYPNRDCPVLDQRCFDEIMRLVFKWARKGPEGN